MLVAEADYALETDLNARLDRLAEIVALSGLHHVIAKDGNLTIQIGGKPAIQQSRVAAGVGRAGDERSGADAAELRGEATALIQEFVLPARVYVRCQDDRPGLEGVTRVSTQTAAQGIGLRLIDLQVRRREIRFSE